MRRYFGLISPAKIGCAFFNPGVLEFQQIPEVPMSLAREIYGFFICSKQELFPGLEQNYGIVSKWFRKLLVVFAIVFVEYRLRQPRRRSKGHQLVHRASLSRTFVAEMPLNNYTDRRNGPK